VGFGADHGVAVTATALISPQVEIPQLYLACPLTNLDDGQRRALTSEVSQVRMCVEQATVGDRVPGEAWPLAIYAPIQNTAPWLDDNLSDAGVYERNLTKVLDSDAVLVLADRAASAGVGQEIEWACRVGIPVLYLSSAEQVSRQIRGIPGTIRCAAYNGDGGTLTAHVANFLQENKHRILDGPRRRDSRRLRFEPLAGRLRHAWERCPDPTGLASRCALDPGYLRMMLTDAARVAMIPADTLTMLCAELGVSLASAARQLPIPATRALILAASAEGWSDETVERLRLHGLAEHAVNPDTDLATLDAWRDLNRCI
jgi:hypothetical protein